MYDMNSKMWKAFRTSILLLGTLSLICQIGFTQEREMKTITCPETGRTIHLMTDNSVYNSQFYPTCQTWSADGKWIFFETSKPPEGTDPRSWQLMQANVETGEIETIASLPWEDVVPYGEAHMAASSSFHSDYSPGTDRIVFYDRSGHHLYNYDRRMRKTVELWHEAEGTIGDPPDYSTDGSRVVFYVLFPGPKENRVLGSRISCIFTLEIDKDTGEAIGEPQPVTCYVERKGSAVSPTNVIINHCQFNPANNEEISFAHEFLGAPLDGSVTKERIWFVRADGRDERPLIRSQAGHSYTHEVFGPKGTHVYYVDTKGVARVDVSTGNVETIVPPNPASCLCHIGISPDEKWIVADSLKQLGTTEDGIRLGSLHLVNADTGECRLLCVFPVGLKHPAHPHPIFSPDGKRVAFTVATPTGCNLAWIDVSDMLKE